VGDAVTATLRLLGRTRIVVEAFVDPVDQVAVTTHRKVPAAS
jgi:hypothetical protein